MSGLQIENVIDIVRKGTVVSGRAPTVIGKILTYGPLAHDVEGERFSDGTIAKEKIFRQFFVIQKLSHKVEMNVSFAFDLFVMVLPLQLPEDVGQVAGIESEFVFGEGFRVVNSRRKHFRQIRDES